MRYTAKDRAKHLKRSLIKRIVRREAEYKFLWMKFCNSFRCKVCGDDVSAEPSLIFYYDSGDAITVCTQCCPTSESFVEWMQTQSWYCHLR